METYHGHVRTPQDAIILFEACRLGLLPRVQRRLSEKERQSIRSGSVFVWDEREAGMRRWTDGKSWSASRVAGSFLNYREMEGKRGGSQQYNSPVVGSGAKHAGHSPPDADMEGGDGPADGYRYKPDGLVKQSFSITTTQGQHLHLISYYSRSDPHAAMLPQPSNDIHLRDIHPQKGMYPDASVVEGQGIPAVTRSPMIGSFHNSSPGTTPNGFPSHQRHHPQFSSGYGWPPSPMNTPPAGHYPHFAAHTPNGYGHSPGYFPGQQQHPQPQQPSQPQLGPPPPSAHYQQQQQQQQHQQQFYGRPPPPGPTAFDRAPPPLSHSLPPPTAQTPHSYGPSHAPGSQYPPHPFQRPPPQPSQGGGPPPPYPYQQASDRQAATTPPYSHGRPVEQQQQQQPPAPTSTFSPLSSAPPPPPSAQKSASTIPSIGSLINKSPPAMHAPPPYAGAAPPSQPQLHHGRRSPPSTTPGAEKTGFSDPGIKALRQLDRHFT